MTKGPDHLMSLACIKYNSESSCRWDCTVQREICWRNVGLW